MALPQRVLEWLETQYEQTASRNTLLLDELNKIVSMLFVRGIPALVLKGPVFAHLSTGLLVRPFHDLDLLVKRRDLGEVASLLGGQGFSRASGVSRQYHEVFVRPERGYAVEVHFDLGDSDRSYTPDVAGLWDRSLALNLYGRVVTTLSLTDHLLVAMMQLPHHHWNLRLVTEIGTVVDRWGDAIDWDVLIKRAREWGMRALAGSTLHAVAWFFRITLPKTLTEFAEPESYFRRIQWQIVRHAVLEQFESSRLDTGRLASLLLPDRFSDAVSLIARRASLADLSDAHGQAVPAGIRRLAGLTSNLPLILRVLTGAAAKGSPAESSFAGTRVD
jgi:hypothetical protein